MVSDNRLDTFQVYVVVHIEAASRNNTVARVYTVFMLCLQYSALMRVLRGLFLLPHLARFVADMNRFASFGTIAVISIAFRMADPWQPRHEAVIKSAHMRRLLRETTSNSFPHEHLRTERFNSTMRDLESPPNNISFLDTRIEEDERDVERERQAPISYARQSMSTFFSHSQDAPDEERPELVNGDAIEVMHS